MITVTALVSASRLLVFVVPQINLVAIALLNVVAAKEAQQLNTDSLERICRCIAFFRIQDGGADITAEEIGMLDI